MNFPPSNEEIEAETKKAKIRSKCEWCKNTGECKSKNEETCSWKNIKNEPKTLLQTLKDEEKRQEERAKKSLRSKMLRNKPSVGRNQKRKRTINMKKTEIPDIEINMESECCTKKEIYDNKANRVVCGACKNTGIIQKINIGVY